MKIGILLPGGYAVVPLGDGRKYQIAFQAEALKRLGHDVLELNPWVDNDLSDIDVLHVGEGSVGNFVNVDERIPGPRAISIAPFIDSNQPNWSYRFMAWLGTRTHRFMNGPGILRRQLDHTDLVIVRSRHERERILQGIGVRAERTRVEIVLNGVTPPTASDPSLARDSLKLPGEYLLHVSTYAWDRKNVEMMIEAVGPTKLPLVIAGNPAGPVAERVKAAATKYKNVQLLGYQTPAMLESLYAGCKVFCLPSLHEGTGLVALEAAAHGAGIVITKNGGPPDYFKDLAYYVEPKRIASIREGILKAWENPRGAELKAHVIDHLTWDHSARSLVKAFETVLGDSSPR